jgi:uncharacterized protein with FMN-binding domain
MRRIVLGFLGTLSGLVLLFSYHTSTSSKLAVASGATGPAGAAPSAAGTSIPSAIPSVAPTTGAAAPSTSSSGAAAGTYTGSAVNTRWGLVQVQITVANGRITASTAVQYPQNNSRDRQINAYAVPTLNQEVVTAQSGSIDTVSGATVTSDGYVQSLQSALDQAHR